MQDTEALTQRILKKITPGPEERSKVQAITRTLEQKVEAVCKEEGVLAVVRVEGSVAKDTWLSENLDIDIFMRLPTSIPRKNLGDVGLKIAKKAAAGYVQLERFAEHPYLEIEVEGYHADIVPCYDAKPGEWQSATDRTPYHTDYIKKHLSQNLLGEVRLLKKFMQGIGVYGAEIKVGGFSGYLSELLIMKYCSFASTVEAFANYNQRLIVDIENYYAERQNELALLFPEPIVIVDPVDKGRNVASAVQTQKLYDFIGASRAFLEAPNEEFFYPPTVHALPPDIVESHLAGQNSTHMYVVIGELTAVPDVLWGQLYRSKRALRKLLEINDFGILRDAVWSNEKSLSVFAFELEQHTVPNVKKHLGPPIERKDECQKFLSKYIGDKRVLSGPFIENGRWVVELPRKYTDVATLLREKTSDGGKNAGIADLVAKAIQIDFNIFLDEEILKVYTENSDFAVFLTEFLSGKPFWLKATV
jgi:tRNA nucleotidyltransferase (CCA-adding enzyme)